MGWSQILVTNQNRERTVHIIYDIRTSSVAESEFSLKGLISEHMN